MKSSTRVTKGKIVVESSAKLAPDAFPLKDWIPGRRRVPSQERSQRTRRQILSAAEALAKNEGVGNITMQMIAAKSKIAAGTAYQFFDDRDAIFAEIYEEWAVTFWATLNKATATPWTDATWRSELRGLITQMGKFYLESSPRWDIIRYVESTKQGRGAMRTLLDANISRFCAWAGPLFRARGYSAAECKAICGALGSHHPRPLGLRRLHRSGVARTLKDRGGRYNRHRGGEDHASQPTTNRDRKERLAPSP